MKKFFYLLIAAGFLMVFACSNTTKEKTEDNKENTEETSDVIDGKFKSKSGIIVYETEVMGMKTTTSLYYDDYGNKICYEVKSPMGVMTTIQKDDKTYVLDMKNKTCTTFDDETEDENDNSFLDYDFDNIESDDMKSLGLKKEANQKFLNKDCQVFSMTKEGAKIKFWVNNNLMLKMETEAMGMKISMAAVKVDENADIPASKFEVPKDFKTVDMKSLVPTE